MNKTAINTTIDTLIRPEIKALNAYNVPSSDGMIKLDAMENPYGWPKELKKELKARLADAAIHRYPDPKATGLKMQLRRVMNVPETQAMMLGNGSDELIQVLAMAIASADRVMMAPEPGFVMYPMVAKFVGMQYVGVPLNSDFSLDLAAFLTAIETHQPSLIFLAYPNNPTGNLFDAEAVEKIIEAAPGVVVVDEAYNAFTDQSFMSRLGQPGFENLLVMRTVSKMGLAGLRLGMLAGSPAWVAELEKLRLPYNINCLTQIAAEFMLKHDGKLAEQADAIRVDRQKMQQDLQMLPGVEVFPSEANFLLVRVPQGKASWLHQQLQLRRILIKKLDGGHPLLTDCLRLTIGTPTENMALMAALVELLDPESES
ncbi:histidinol-phosphate transaminase [Pelagibaculum spongiae]|uniref:Histidinol-phosphate aminotransferase n=1 Tax=Pelagibaculum spongiae TaxID=2080658 RepID=A0A2V1GZP6_9GAMM|nr:histidinol-phosphate transaminase [Pelagibaculum spongiae]PVZ71909.1 histidinol-phosphate transaminase [Pelagibaculum spongiae]